MRELTHRIANSLRRLASVVRKEIVELLRQPGLLAILVIGPLLILLVFGSGVRSSDPSVTAVFVTPEDNPQLTEIVQRFADSQDERLSVQEVISDEAEALQRLRTGEVDVVIVVPDDALEAVQNDERATVRVLHAFIDPLEAQAMALFTSTGVDEINDLLVERVISEAQSVAGDTLEEAEAEGLTDEMAEDAAAENGVDAEQAVDDAEALIEQDPRVLARPLQGDSTSIAGDVTSSQFYGPAVVALIVQHLILTFVALSLVRQREQGISELLQVSPLRPVEGLLGLVVAYLLVGSVLSGVLVGAVALLLGAGLATGIGPVALILVLEMLAAMGVGFILAALARTTTQVVQGAMLLLLVSVFFGGLLLSPERLQPWARPVGWGLPMSPAIQMLRDAMLRGTPLDLNLLAWLGGLAAAALVIGAGLTLRRARVR